jgi:hypothetical protein
MSPRTSTPSGKTTKTEAKQAAPLTTNPRRRSAAKRPGLVTTDDRQRYIAEAAYYKAEKRGFTVGGELADWIEAEAEIDALLDSRGAG